MTAVLSAPQARFEPLSVHQLDEVLRIESSVYAHPWTVLNFADALSAGYQAQLLKADSTLLGYFVAMKGVDEVHLLNLTVARAYQGQGWARVMLDALAIWARTQGVAWLWLEVRVGNARALQVYQRHGFRRVGERKAYYPAAHGQREDAVVMNQRL